MKLNKIDIHWGDVRDIAVIQEKHRIPIKVCLGTASLYIIPEIFNLKSLLIKPCIL